MKPLRDAVEMVGEEPISDGNANPEVVEVGLDFEGDDPTNWPTEVDLDSEGDDSTDWETDVDLQNLHQQ